MVEGRRQACPSYSGSTKTFVFLLFTSHVTDNPLAMGSTAWLTLAHEIHWDLS